LLSKAISENGYKVVLSGTGADELVTGYYDHFLLHLYEMRGHPDYPRLLNEWEGAVKGLVRNPCLSNPRLYFDDPGFRRHIYYDGDDFSWLMKADFRERFREENYSDSLLRNRMLNELFHETIPQILHEDDLNSMFYSLENRSPYLDSRLFSFAYSIPNEHLISGGYAKFILREAAKGVLNEGVRCERRKIGFNASISSLVDFSDQVTRSYLLSDSPVFEIIRKDKIAQLFAFGAEAGNSLSKFLFNFINAKIFLEAFIAPRSIDALL
jgi:asparagine synthase (glutamine-hydrolysing)